MSSILLASSASLSKTDLSPWLSQLTAAAAAADTCLLLSSSRSSIRWRNHFPEWWWCWCWCGQKLFPTTISSCRTSTTCTSTSFVVAATKHPFLFGLFFTKVLRFYNTNKSSARCIRDFSDILQRFTIHHHLSHLLTRFFGRKTCRLWKRNT